MGIPEDLMSPRAAGFVRPAEWELQAATWVSWPGSNPETWPNCREAALDAWGHFVAVISRYQSVCINAGAVHHDAVRACVAGAGAAMDRVRLFDHPVNDAWCRDYGPVFVRHVETGEVAVTDWPYNAWGAKFAPWDEDDRNPARVAESLGMRRFPVGLTGEGGGLECNGAGDLLVTESVWLNPNRNPGVTRDAADVIFRETLGVERVHWLAQGMEGDDTDGHIDTFARYVSADRAVVSQADAGHPHHAVLAANRKRLEAMVSEVVALPHPDPICPENWREPLLPATYANFIFVNGAVLVPTYAQPENDARALDVLRKCFPEREVVGVPCEVLVIEGGALHCLSMEQPVGE